MNNIIHNIWIGNIYDACKYGEQFRYIINVMHKEEIGAYERAELFALRNPILIFSHFMAYERDEDEKYIDVYADIPKLNDIANLIETCSRFSGVEDKCLVQCAFGEERSPLAVTWYLYTSGRTSVYKSFDQLYDFVKKQHPPTLDRKEWLKKANSYPFEV